MLFGNANVPERQRPFLYKRNQSVRTVAGEFEAQIFALYTYLNSDEVYDSGFLWWDSVHLSSYGQDLTVQ